MPVGQQHSEIVDRQQRAAVRLAKQIPVSVQRLSEEPFGLIRLALCLHQQGEIADGLEELEPAVRQVRPSPLNYLQRERLTFAELVLSLQDEGQIVHCNKGLPMIAA